MLLEYLSYDYKGKKNVFHAIIGHGSLSYCAYYS